MGSDETLVDLIGKSRMALQDAKRDAEQTPRPKNACSAHDVQFALAMAQATASDTILAVLVQLLREKEMSVKQKWAKMCIWPATVLASIALFAPQGPAMLQIVLNHFSK